MSISARDANDYAAQLLILTERLTERLTGETEALEAHRPLDIRESVEETRSLSALYRQESARLKADPSRLKGLSNAHKDSLRRATEAFVTISERHARAVEAAKAISEGLMKAVADSLNETRKPSLTYGPGAAISDRNPQSLNYGFKA
ncbi:flagellar basal-body protein FlbY [Asticcacaulis sp. AND118]|uniref:flagellar basal-body protein FlbY n=1 Tax=Asticcacaulis sp. AND118 TaxID=2840468 RepID=UPI001CFF829D|nr:flagellar basal-body protein FlbY [Asticcacaulis sp. AND118]UDF02579.1 flagellar basal-body protein FlbY [Asticcacaulis sp. AND118]